MTERYKTDPITLFLEAGKQYEEALGKATRQAADFLGPSASHRSMSPSACTSAMGTGERC